MNAKLIPAIVLSVCTTLTSGCAPLIVGGAATGAATVYDRRTAGSVLEDQAIEIKAVSALRSERGMYAESHFNVVSYNGIVLLSGETPTEAWRARAEELVRNIEKVKRVHNEVTVGPPSTLLSRSTDTVITGKVKTGLIGIRDIEGFDPTRVKVVTEHSVVYLMGMVTRTEGDRSAEVASQVGGVERVVKVFEYQD
jgi:osmotically-inducible protein OsmY